MAYNLPDGFEIDRIGQSVLAKHHHFINHEWKGPDLYKGFKVLHLLYTKSNELISVQTMTNININSKHLKTKAKNGKILDILTIIYDRRGYKKRCNNSQEDWFRKYDGEFLALCIHQVRQLLGNSKLKKMHFGFQLLSKKVKFEWSKATSLVPTSWIFGTSVDKLQMALTELLQIDIKSLKRSEDKQKKRTALVSFVKSQYIKFYKLANKNNNNNLPPYIFNNNNEKNQNGSGSKMDHKVKGSGPGSPKNVNINVKNNINNDHHKNKRKRDREDSNHSIKNNLSNNNDTQTPKKRRIDHRIRATLTSPRTNNSHNNRIQFNKDRMGQKEFLNQQPKPMGPLNPYQQSFKNAHQSYLRNPPMDKTILSRLPNVKKIRYSISGAPNTNTNPTTIANPSPRSAPSPHINPNANPRPNLNTNTEFNFSKLIIPPKPNGHKIPNLPNINNGHINRNNNMQLNGNKNNHFNRNQNQGQNQRLPQIPKPSQCVVHGPKSPINFPPNINTNGHPHPQGKNGISPRIAPPNNLNNMNNVNNIINNINNLSNLSNLNNINGNKNGPTSVSISISNETGAELQRLRKENAQLKQQLAAVNNKSNLNQNSNNNDSSEATIPVAVSTLAELFEKIRTYEVFLEQLFGQSVITELFNNKNNKNSNNNNNGSSIATLGAIPMPAIPSMPGTRENSLPSLPSLPTLGIPGLPALAESATNILPALTSLGTLPPIPPPQQSNGNNVDNKDGVKEGKIKIKTDTEDNNKGIKSEDSSNMQVNNNNDKVDEVTRVKSEPH